MKAQIEVLLSMWGRWAIRRASGALGYPRTSPMFREMPAGDAYGNSLPLDVADCDLEAVDRSVNCLPMVLKVVVIEVYQRSVGKSHTEIARVLGVDRKTLGKYISSAHDWIAIDMRNQFPQNTQHLDNFHQSVSKPASL